MALDWALYHMRLVGRLHGVYTQTGYWFMAANQSEEYDHFANCHAIIERFNAGVLPYIKEWGNQNWALIGVICATMYPRFGPIVEHGYEVGGGNQIGESLPSFVCGVLSLRTGLGGRSHIGRTYYPAISEGDSALSELTATQRSRLQGIGDALLNFFGAPPSDNEFYYGVYSHKLGDQPLPAPAVGKYVTPAGFQPIVQTIARRYVFTQRKRLIGHGP